MAGDCRVLKIITDVIILYLYECLVACLMLMYFGSLIFWFSFVFLSMAIISSRLEISSIGWLEVTHYAWQSTKLIGGGLSFQQFYVLHLDLCLLFVLGGYKVSTVLCPSLLAIWKSCKPGSSLILFALFLLVYMPKYPWIFRLNWFFTLYPTFFINFLVWFLGGRVDKNLIYVKRISVNSITFRCGEFMHWQGAKISCRLHLPASLPLGWQMNM